MTADEFNDKYKAYNEKGFIGLEFDIPVVTKMLDEVFATCIKIPNFSYSQIKLKFDKARVYTSLSHETNTTLEVCIDVLIKHISG